MQELPVCRQCHFYANSRFLVCTLHPQGISEENNCSDFNPAKDTFHRQNRFENEDLDLAEGLLLNQGYHNLAAHHSRAEITTEMYFDSTRDL